MRAGLHLVRTELTEVELNTSIQLTSLVDDGEAQALAIARHRGVLFLSDDGPGLRAATQIGVRSLTTLELAKSWAADKAIAEVQAACQRLRQRARYDVPRNHPLAEWYRSNLVGPDSGGN